MADTMRTHMEGTDAQAEVRAVIEEMIDADNAGNAARLRPLYSERPDAVISAPTQ